MRSLVPAALAAAVLLASPVLDAGGQLGKVELEGFTQTKAKSFDDLYGRVVLIEFFAFW
jgi:hypothetical protein